MNNPIGIFDSGIGGLTVVKELIKLLPKENLVYFGDTARVPYGTRSVKLIKQYSLEDAAFLEQFNIKLLIIACNTASAVAVDLLQSSLVIPVTGVIDPVVSAAIKQSKEKRIGVIGTTATIKSQAYNKQIHKQKQDIQVYGQPCPLLVPLVEEGWVDDEITRLTIRKYLAPLLEKKVDTIILGCTHFPVLKDLIQEEVGPDVDLIDSGQETAKVVLKMIENKELDAMKDSDGSFQCFVSDIPDKFDEVGTRFLGKPVVNAQRVDFDTFLIEKGEKIYAPLNLNEEIV
jgi:glutamate racemase